MAGFEKQATVVNQLISKFASSGSSFALNQANKALHADTKERNKRLAKLQRLEWECTGLIHKDRTFLENERDLNSVGLRTVEITKDEEELLSKVIQVNNSKHNLSEDEYDQKKLSFPHYASLREKYSYLNEPQATWPLFVDYPNVANPNIPNADPDSDAAKQRAATLAVLKDFMFLVGNIEASYDHFFVNVSGGGTWYHTTAISLISNSWRSLRSLKLSEIALYESDFETILKMFVIDNKYESSFTQLLLPRLLKAPEEEREKLEMISGYVPYEKLPKMSSERTLILYGILCRKGFAGYYNCMKKVPQLAAIIADTDFAPFWVEIFDIFSPQERIKSIFDSYETSRCYDISKKYKVPAEFLSYLILFKAAKNVRVDKRSSEDFDYPAGTVHQLLLMNLYKRLEDIFHKDVPGYKERFDDLLYPKDDVSKVEKRAFNEAEIEYLFNEIITKVENRKIRIMLYITAMITTEKDFLDKLPYYDNEIFPSKPSLNKIRLEADKRRCYRFNQLLGKIINYSITMEGEKIIFTPR